MKKNKTPPTPKSITAEWIRKQKAPYFGVEAYFYHLVRNRGNQDTMTLVRGLPPGYVLIYLFWRFYTDVQNGGFWQFLGNTYAIDKSQQVVVETVETLDRVGMPELAVLLKKSIAVLGGHLPKRVLAILPSAERQKAAKRRPSDDQIQSGMDPIDAAFNRMELSSFPKFDEYIKQHPEEFIHGDK